MALSALLLLLLCAPARAAAPDSVLLVGWDGSDRKHVERLLDEGRLPSLAALLGGRRTARAAVTTGTTQTKPGWAEVLTGYSAPRLGVLSNSHYAPIPAGWTLLERLKERVPGLRAFFIASKSHNVGSRGPHEVCVNALHRDPKTRRGTRYQDRRRFTGLTEDGKPPVWERRLGEPYHLTAPRLDLRRVGLGPPAAVYRETEKALGGLGGRPFAAFVHFGDADETAHRHGVASARYDEAIVEQDRWLGRLLALLERRGLARRALVLVACDHGMDAGGFQHDAAPDAFLAARGLRLRDGDRKDVAPTVYAALGLGAERWDPPLDGRSLIEPEAAP